MNQPPNSMAPVRIVAERVICPTIQRISTSQRLHILQNDFTAVPLKEPQSVAAGQGDGLEIEAYVEFVSGEQPSRKEADREWASPQVQQKGAESTEPSATLMRIESPIMIEKRLLMTDKKQVRETREFSVQTDQQPAPSAPSISSPKSESKPANPFLQSSPPRQAGQELLYLKIRLEETERRLGEENAMLRETLLELLAKLENYKEEADTYEKRCQELEVQRRVVLETSSGCKVEESEARRHILELEKKFSEVEISLRNKDIELNSLRGQFQRVNTELTASREVVLDLTTNVNNSASKFNGLLQSHQQLQQHHERLLKSIDILEKEKKQFSTTVTELKSQKESLQMQLLVVAEENGQLAKALSQANKEKTEKEKSEMEGSKDEKRGRIGSAELPPTYSSFKTPLNSDKKSMFQDRTSRIEQRQKRVTTVRSIRQTLSKNVSESSLVTVIDTVEFLMNETEFLESDNKKLREALDKLTRLLETEKRRPKGQEGKQKHMDVDDQILFQQVVKELQRQKMANRQLSHEVDNLSQVLMKAQEQLMQKAETINDLIQRPTTSMKSSYHEVQNLRRHLHHFGGVADRRTRSNILHQVDPREYKGHLEKIAREVHESEISEKEYAMSQASRLQNKLVAYEKSLVPDLERQLMKYRRLYDDALFALNQKSAEAEELHTDLEILKGKYLMLQRNTPSSFNNIKSDSHISAFGLRLESRMEKLSEKKSSHLIGIDSAQLQQIKDQIQAEKTLQQSQTLSQSHSQNLTPVQPSMPPPLLLEQPFSRRMPLIDLMKNTTVSVKALTIIAQKLCEICIKMVHSKAFPIIRLDNILIVDYDEKDPTKIKVKLVDLQSGSKALMSPRNRLEMGRFTAPELGKGGLASDKSMVWNLGTLVQEMLNRQTSTSTSPSAKKQEQILRQFVASAVKVDGSLRPTLQDTLKRLQEKIEGNSKSPLSPVVEP